MTDSAVVPAAETRSGPERPSRRCVRSGLLLTAAWVAGGAALVLTAAPPPPRSPDQVAHAFLTAGYSGEVSAAWDLLCAPIHENHTYAEFAERMDRASEQGARPADLDVTVSDVRRSRGPDGPSFTVVVDVTSSEWPAGAGFTSELLVVEEDGGFRVCSDPGPAA